MSSAKRVSRRVVSRPSRRKVGRMRNVSASCWSRLRERGPDLVRVADQLAQLPAARTERAEDLAGVPDEALRGVRLLVEHLEHVARVLGEGRQEPERVVEALCVVERGHARLIHPDRELRARLRVEGAQDLVELDGLRDVPGREPPTVLDRARGRRPGAELHVGLPEQRLLPQDRARVLRDRHVAGVDLELRVRQPGLLVRLEGLDPADAHARDADVGLLGELGGVGEGDGHAVSLRLQRHRAAEAEPEEDEDPEARQRERDHREYASEAGGLLDHGTRMSWLFWGQTMFSGGRFRRRVSMPSCGLPSTTLSSVS